MQLTQNLIITTTNQKARDLKKSSSNPFDKIVSLDSFINELFEKISFKMQLDPFIAKELIFSAIQSNNISYFDYIAKDGSGIDLILDFITKIERNELQIELFHSGEKLLALQTIQNAYNDFKSQHNLVDISDIEKEVLLYLQTNILESYDGIFIDKFIKDDIRFTKSSLQEKIVQTLQTQYQKLHEDIEETNHCTLYEPLKKPFDVVDEVKLALKLARKILQTDTTLKESDICFVATDIEEYAPLFRNISNLFGLKVYDSVGIPLGSFTNKSNLEPHIQEQFNQINQNAKSIKEKAKRYGFELDLATIKSNLIENARVLEDKIGIELTEANQLATINTTYQHIIFVGVDMNHFPPKSSENFLYTNDQNVEYFFGNNYFESSLFQYNALKRIAKNLYILHPSYKEKRQIHRSIIVNDTITHTFEANDIQEQKRKVNDEAYLASVLSEDFTSYDGIDVDGIKANHLSASQLGSYAKCPLKYLYTNKLKLKAPKQESNGFEVSQEGTLMHSCFESFAKEVRGKTNLSLEEMHTIMQSVLEDEYQKFLIDPKNEILEENIYHHTFKTTLGRGLDNNNASKGLLAKFVTYYDMEKENLEYLSKSEFEKPFALDSNLLPYRLKDENDTNYFIKGFIDRFDNLRNFINIVDYKSKKADSVSQEKLEEIKDFKDFQLGLYSLYATQHYKKDVDAYLLTFKSDKNLSTKFARVATNEELIPQYRKKDTGVLYDKGYEGNLKVNIFKIKKSIEEGDFRFDNSDEKQCGYCEIRFMCNNSFIEGKKVLK